MLKDMIAFMSDRYAVPPFLKPKLQAEYHAAAASGSPVHVGQQPWGVWGPLMVTHFAAKHGILDRVQPVDAFYPVIFPERLKFLRPRARVDALLTDRTTALHLWASNKRELGLRFGGVPPDGSMLADLLIHHNVDPQAAPIKGRGKQVFDAGLLDAVGLEKADVFADIGGHAQPLAAAAYARFGCQIDLIDVDAKGAFCAQASDWVAPYVTALKKAGVPTQAIRRLDDLAALRPADLIANLTGFGDLAKVKHLAPLLPAMLGPGTQMITDIRKGSGAYPFLKGFGTTTPLQTRTDGGVEIARVLLTAPQIPDQISEPWPVLAARLAGPQGFVRDDGKHSFLYVPRGDTLVVTFDNLDIAMTKRSDRRPWGYSFIEKQGWSMLGVMANGWTWYRDKWVWDQFDDLAKSGFFKSFRRVVFYGASMGGYAACAFVSACPGADVLAISPQSTLDKTVVPWETRYKTAWNRDFSGPYGDAADVSQAARKVTILYDPFEPLDAGHADRFGGANVTKLRASLMGHRLGSSLQQMGILSQITLSALNGTLTEPEFYRALRARKTFGRYQKELFDRAVARGRPDLARRLGRWVLTRGDNRAIRKGLTKL
jgi:hypothetical protein